MVKEAISSKHSVISKLCMSEGLKKSFPDNCFSVMVLSGAKGSVLNHNQISCMLGQQELEGQRVPIMASGRTLPSFIPYDPNARAGGFIADRFLTGLRPQEFYFHCMAGREGLIDTAVKTSRSGYLQRILVKNLESLIIQYDYTVRNNDGTVIQFLYGEDGLDSIKVNPLEKVGFMADNMDSFAISSDSSLVKKSLEKKLAKKWRKNAAASPEEFNYRSITNELPPQSHFGSISEAAYNRLNAFFEKDSRFKKNKEKKKNFKDLYFSKYFASLACPGEAVGAIAAQSFGEPSTQMTLNTFHLAGHGGANVTLGIPRLRELLVTRGTKLPSMNLYFKDTVTKFKAKAFARSIQKVSLFDLIHEIEVTERKQMLSSSGTPLPPEERFRAYEISFSFEDLKAIKFAFGLSSKDLAKCLNSVFKPKLMKSLHKLLEKKNVQKGTTLMAEETADSAGAQLGYMNYDLENIRMKKEGTHRNDDPEGGGVPDQSEYDDDRLEEDDDELGNMIANIEQGDDTKRDTKKPSSNYNSKEITKILDNFSFEGAKCYISLKYPLNVEKLLMVNIVEDICKLVTVREVPNIKKSHVVTDTDGSYYIQTEGVNFQACWTMKDIDASKLDCNDTHSICSAYGIEAARGALAREINRVFSHYGIKVDYRHLSLVTDYMTNNGYVNPMSRAGLQHNTSPFLKMSFETTMRFLTESCLFNNYDNLSTPSGRLVLGRPVQNGTGLFGVRQDLTAMLN